MRSHNNSTGSKEGAEVEEKGTAVDNDSSSSIISKQAAIPSDHGLSIAAVQTQTCDVDLVVRSSNVNNEDGIIFDVGASKKSTAHMQNGSKNGAYHSKRNVIQTSEASNANSMTAIVPSMPRCTERPGAGRGIKRNGTVASATIKSGGRGRKKRRGRPPNNARKPKPAKEVVADAKVQGTSSVQENDTMVAMPLTKKFTSAASANGLPGTDAKKNLAKIKEYRWRAHRAAEDYISLVGDLMYPGTYMGAFGYSHEQGNYPVERPCTLGLLTSPLRRPTVIERWSPYEIACFEAAITMYGKIFHEVQKVVKTKTTKEIIEFYYIWKKTSHYKKWKQQLEPEVDDNEVEELDWRQSRKK